MQKLSTGKFHGVPLGDTNAIPIPVPLKGAAMSGCDTKLPTWNVRAPVAIGGKPDNICSV
jgi:hypothetical protein